MKKKPKIGFLIPRLGVINRGAEVFVFELSRYLAKYFDIVIWVEKSSKKSELLKELKNKGVVIKKVWCLSEESFLSKLLYQIKPLRQTLDKFQFNPMGTEMLTFSLACLPQLLLSDCQILFPVNGAWGALACRLVKFFRRIPFVYSSQGGIEPIIARQKPATYFTINKEIQRWYKKYFPDLKTVFIPNGVNLQRFSPKGKKAGIKLEKPIVLAAGALIPAKKIEAAVWAVAKLKKGSLLVLGKGPLKKEIEQLGEKLLGKKRFLLKSTSHFKIPKYYRAADIFTFPCEKGEPFSLVTLEALASGLPVVAENDEIRRLMVGKAGILVDTDNIQAYSEALKKAINKNFGILPRKQAEKFSWERIGRKYEIQLMEMVKAMTRPKIATLVPRFGLVDRGVESFTKEFLSRLGKDFDITIYSRVKTIKETKSVVCIPESNKALGWIYGLNPWFKKWLDKYFLNPFSFEMLTFSVFTFPHLLFNDYDLIFSQNGVWGAIACRIIRAIKKTPFIYRSAGGKEPPIVRQKPNIYIATNPEIHEWIKSYRPDTKVVLIPNGVDLDKFSSRVEPIPVPLEKPIYLCVGALIPAKRIDLAIKAVGQLKKGSLCVVAQGPLRNEIRELGEKLLGKKRFLLKEKVTYQRIPRYYVAGDVFTLPSWEEPFGIVHLEAMASGLPVVAPEDKSRRYIVGKAGILCDVLNLKEYAEALLKASGKSFGNLPRKQAEKFSWEKIGNQYKDELMKLLS